MEGGEKEMVGIKMYAKIQELKTKGYKKQRAARELDIDVKTVRKYWEMTEDEYVDYQIETKNRTKIMDPYREFVLERIKAHPEISNSIIEDNLREEYPNFEPSYRSVRLYVSVHLCRKSDPESKGKIESVVKYVKQNFLTCRTYHGISALNSAGLRTCCTRFQSTHFWLLLFKTAL